MMIVITITTTIKTMTLNGTILDGFVAVVACFVCQFVFCCFRAFFLPAALQIIPTAHVAKVQYVIQAEHSFIILAVMAPPITGPAGSAKVYVYPRLPLFCQFCCVLVITYLSINSFSYGLFTCILSRNSLLVFDNGAAYK